RAEARYRASDDPRIARGERFIAQAHRLHHSGTKVVDHNVGLAGQTQHHVAPGALAQIDLHTLLGAVGAHEEVAVRTGIASQLCPRAFDRLDLDDFGPIVTE